MSNIQLFNVAPRMPDELRFLEELSFNMWWCWHPLAIELFIRINPALWEAVGGNARQFLGEVPQSRLDELCKDENFLRQLGIVEAEFNRQLAGSREMTDRRIAYFSMEFGIHESLRLYSGGLGILAGDHLKAASDLNLPLIGVGLLYRQGYFRQYLDRNGWQIERYPENELHNMPITRARDKEGNEVVISVRLLDRDLFAAVWVLQVGNVPLVLLDAEIPQNPPEFRELTWRLYGGDKRMRLQQELLLGIGGFNALVAMGYEPAICHMNEGHAAFLSLARIKHMVEHYNLDPDTALEVVWRSNIFTTHTPVPAGNEVFDLGLARPYLEPLCGEARIDVQRMINWGIPINDRNRSNEMSMTVLGLRLANYSNGVSRLHGEVARNMWKHLWPGRAIDEIPIKHITNGVHIQSWVSQRKWLLYDRYLRPDWRSNADEKQMKEAIYAIPDEELWMAHELCRQSLIRKLRHLLQNSLRCLPTAGCPMVHAKNVLDPDVLTIGFARRFATYKRGTLLLRDPERLVALLTDQSRPVQFIFAGKAHPADEEGKRLIQQLIQFARQHNVSNRLLFIEDYDIGLARRLVQGVDVWLNTPRRPQEASGTSGMKAAVNGVINCSILDGWWDEAYRPDCGWAIVGNENYEDPEDTDNYESQVLFDLLENEIIPCFYDRPQGDLPIRWLRLMKGSIAMALGKFSSRRMVTQYDEMFYRPAIEAFDHLMADDAQEAHKLVEQKARLIANFEKLWVAEPTIVRSPGIAHVGDVFKISTEAYLAEMKPEELAVQVYYGQVNAHNEIIKSACAAMKPAEDLGEGRYRYEYELRCPSSGRFAMTARITPVSSYWVNSVPGFMCWAK
ncbi:alpha-glucan family phosphorylase [Victivallis sp. Marseille-Q1083]|uniref:alpha-glucan family phosphorylase n=1 Tax=Victivallis sp. Marseille-Q1083 TaxID=2717288 RepID=UPI00158EAB31|nr:alpha-glucan family phosphorylase [Victivallis sp. Marseille-Q1083]